MQPGEFENYVADLFSRLGFKTEAVGRSHDGGIDVIAEKGGIKHYIQCKKFITQEVGVGAIRDFYGAIANHLAQGKGYFITTNKFTLEAEKFAEDKPVELIDGQKIIKYIRLAEKESGRLERETTMENCPQCGGSLIKKDGKFGKFYGCSNYPRCRFTKKS
jgi:restriction system protein